MSMKIAIFPASILSVVCITFTAYAQSVQQRFKVAELHPARLEGCLSDAPVTFALTGGGHNAGIVSEPGHPHRHFRIATKAPADALLSAEEWIAATSIENGSWWPAWAGWLIAHSTGEPGPPPSMGAPESGLSVLADAPGTYVMQS